MYYIGLLLPVLRMFFLLFERNAGIPFESAANEFGF